MNILIVMENGLASHVNVDNTDDLELPEQYETYETEEALRKREREILKKRDML